ncbi:DNA-directed RNA polymerase subunit L [Candidatus Woesearchaeota archaeon]|nr:DNA-directed RNA polymerase subunit L [Candidatus Woesearchaeota archaeon]
MELNVVEKSKNRIIIEIKGETHTLCNALKEELYSNPDVKAAGYYIEHPEVGIPRLVVETKKNSPQKVISDALKKLIKKNEKFLDAFNKEVK